MFVNEMEYLDLLTDILDEGIEGGDRTGVGTKSIFGRQLRFDLTKSFPLLTTKKVPWKKVVSELLWFIEGSGDERRLAEIHYGKDRSELEGKTTIWTENAQDPKWKAKGYKDGDLGQVYGVQWRHWKKYDFESLCGDDFWQDGVTEVDQLSELIEKIKTKPNDRRHILTAWNPGEVDQMALPPCHMMAQFYVRNGELSCLMTQRSADMFLGVPFNIASYSLLTLMIAHVCGLKPKEFILSLGDAHIYSNHYDQVNEQLSRKPLAPPTVVLNPDITSIDDFKMSDVFLKDYESHSAIEAKMAV